MNRWLLAVLAVGLPLAAAPATGAGHGEAPLGPPVPDQLPAPDPGPTDPTPPNATGASPANATVFEEGFRGPAGLVERGFRSAHLAPGSGFALADASPLGLKEAEGRVAAVDGYVPGFEGRLVGPVVDLSNVPGSSRPDEPTAPPPIEDIQRETANATQEARRNASQAGPAGIDLDPREPRSARAEVTTQGLGSEVEQALGWPPDLAAPGGRANATPLLPGEPNLRALPNATAGASTPDGADDATATRLVLDHAFDLAAGHGAVVEARVLGEDGWTDWRRLPATVPPDERPTARPVADDEAPRTYEGRDGHREPAFTGSSGGIVRSVFPLDEVAGTAVQFGFRLDGDAVVPPDGFGWALDRLAVQAPTTEPDVAVEGFRALEDGARVAEDAELTPSVVVRNWGPTPEANLTVVATVEQPGATSSQVATLTTGRLEPGEAQALDLPDPLPADAEDLRLSARRSGDRVDTRPGNDAVRIEVGRADAPAVDVELSPASGEELVPVGEDQGLELRTRLAGNVGPGEVDLTAQRLDRGDLEPVGDPVDAGTVDPGLPDPPVPVAGEPVPVGPARTATATWTPPEAGVYEVTASVEAAQALGSPSTIVFAGVGRPATFQEDAEPSRAQERAQPLDAAALLDGWRFDAWTHEDNRTRRLPAAPASPAGQLAAFPADRLGGHELGLARTAGARADDAGGKLRFELPTGAAPAIEEDTRANATLPDDVAAGRAGYAELLRTAEPVLCREPPGTVVGAPVACGDVLRRAEVVDLDAVREASVNATTLTVEKNTTRLEGGNATVGHGGEDGFLFVRVPLEVEPGLDARASPLTVERGNGEQARPMPPSPPVAFESGGERGCCVFGPYSLEELAEGLDRGADPPAQAEGADVSRRTSALVDLSDLVEEVPEDAARVAISLEHRGLFDWTDGAGVRGLVRLETEDETLPIELNRTVERVGAPLSDPQRTPRDRVVLEEPTAGTEELRLEVSPRHLTEGARLNLTLERDPGPSPVPDGCPQDPRRDGCLDAGLFAVDGLPGGGLVPSDEEVTSALPACPYTEARAQCLPYPAWFVDEVRVLVPSVGDEPWRTVAREPFDARDAPDLGPGSRGWTVLEAPDRAPHRFHLAGQVDAGPRDPSTPALRWGDPSNPGDVTTEPRWSIAQSPRLDLSNLTDPRVELGLRYDFGATQEARAPAGGALVARLDPHDGGPPERVLLEPRGQGPPGAGYRGEVVADGFRNLSRALDVEVPAGASATAFVGRSGVPLEGQGSDAQPSWVDVTADLAPIADRLDDHQLTLELHAIAGGPLTTDGWAVDDLTVRDAGPAYDLVATRLLSPPGDPGVADERPVPLTVEVEDRGAFRPDRAEVNVTVRSTGGEGGPPEGELLYQETVALGPTQLPGGRGDRVPVTLPDPWEPPRDGTARVTAEVDARPRDDVPGNDRTHTDVGVTELAAARLVDPDPSTPTATLVDPAQTPVRLGEPVPLQVEVENRGTVPFGAGRPLDLVVQVLRGEGEPVLDRPIRIGVQESLGRSLGPGEQATVDLEGAWEPSSSGVYQVRVDLDAPDVRSAPLVDTMPVVAEGSAPPLAEWRASGDGWTNATRGDPPSAWSFQPGPDGGEGALAPEAPLDLHRAMRATVELEHRHELERAFDGGRLEARVPGGLWHPVPVDVPPREQDGTTRYEGYPGRVVDPTPLNLRNASTVPAFTGQQDTRVTRFDLAEVPALRDRVVFGATEFPSSPDRFGLREDPRFEAANRLTFDRDPLGPDEPPGGDRAWHADGDAPPDPEQAPDGAIAHLDRDLVAFQGEVPQDEQRAGQAARADDLAVQVDVWQALGLHGNPAAPPSEVRLLVRGPVVPDDPSCTDLGDQARWFEPEPEPTPAYDDNHRNWTTREATFEGAADALRGEAFCVVVVHEEVHARAPEDLAVANRPTPAFASDLVSSHGGAAVTGLEAGPLIGDELSPLVLRGPTTGTDEGWIAPGQQPDHPSLEGMSDPRSGAGFDVLRGPDDRVDDRVWDESRDRDGRRVATPGGTLPESRLVAPVDLSPAVGGVRLELNATWNLTTVATEDGPRAASLAGVAVSPDGGATWFPIEPANGSRALDDGSLAGARHSPLSPVPKDPEANSPLGPGGVGLTGDQPTPRTVSFNLTPFAGQPVLIGLQASFSTLEPARQDDVTLHEARVDGEVFSSGPVELRFRAAADGDGPSEGWDLVDLDARVVEHGPGVGARVVAPTDEPLVETFPTLGVELVNRGPTEVPEQRVGVRIHDAPEAGGRTHHANRTVPGLEPGESRVLEVDGADLNWLLPAGAPAEVELGLPGFDGEAFAADNNVRGEVGGGNVVPDDRLVPRQIGVTPQALGEDDEAVTFHVEAVNRGEDAVVPGASTVRIVPTIPPNVDLPEDPELRREALPDPVRNLTLSPDAASVPAQGTVNLTRTWQPGDRLEPGSYRVVVDVVTAGGADPPLERRETFLWVGDLDERAYVERFPEDPQQAPSYEDWTCRAGSPCARATADRARSPPQSLAVGIPGGDDVEADGRAVLRTAPFPTERYESARLSAFVQHDLVGGDRAFVEAAPVYRNGSTGDYRTVLELAGRSEGLGEDRFEEVSARLDALLAPDDATTAVRLRIDAPQPPPNGTPALWIDDVSVTPVDAALGAPESVPIQDGVTKRLFLPVRNEGTLGDAYRFAFEDRAGREASTPEGWTVRLVDPEEGTLLASTASNRTTEPLAVGGGNERLLHLEVTTEPAGAEAPLRGDVELPLTLRSTELPTLVRDTRIELRADERPRAELAVAGIENGDPGGSVGTIRSVQVLVENRGFAPAQAPVQLEVQPPADAGQPPRALATAAGDRRPSVQLPPGGVRSISFQFTPREAGEATLRAQVDGSGLLEANRTDNAASVTAQVEALPFPDLVTRLEDVPDRLPVGQAQRFNVTVVNEGPRTAENVQVQLRAGPENLLEEARLGVGNLDPGEAWERTVPWRPGVPGDVRLVGSAGTGGGLEEPVATREDNAEGVPVQVLEAALAAAPIDGAAPLEAPFQVENTGNRPLTVDLAAEVDAEAASAIRVDGTQTATVELEPGEVANATVRLLERAETRAGTAPVRLAASADGVEAAASGTARVPAEHDLRLRVAEVPVDPADPALAVRVANAGNVVEDVHLEPVRLPDGWSLGADRIGVPPGPPATQRIAVEVDGPPAPGTAEVDLAWNTTAQHGRLEGRVDVPRDPALSLDVQGPLVAGADAPVSVELSNHGNVPVDGTLGLVLGEGFATDLADRGVSLDPGASASRTGLVHAPPSASDAASATLRLPNGSSVDVNLTVDAVDLGVPRLEVPGDARSGTRVEAVATVANEGDVAVERPRVTLFADGEAVATRTVDGGLEPAAVADLRLGWDADAGDHSLVARVTAASNPADADPDDQALARDVEVEAGELLSLDRLREAPGPAGSAAAAALAAAGLALAARRDRP